MITNQPIHFISPKDCPYRLRGRNLSELRRAELRPLAKALKVDPDGIKNDILRRVIAKLKLINAEKELDEKFR